MPEDISWPEAQQRATALGIERRTTAQRPLAEALGLVLAESLRSLVDLPPFDTAAMDGWAVRGAGPWRQIGESSAGRPGPPVREGQCVAISTGAVAPAGTAVLRSEAGRVVGDRVTADAAAPAAGHDVRRRGEEVRAGEEILASGQVMTPPAVGLAAAGGHDRAVVHPVPTIAVIVLGDELDHSGIPGSGRLRDALAPQLPGWIAAMGATTTSLEHVTDSEQATQEALQRSVADIVITTGGTARGRADHIDGAVRAVGGRWIVDRVAVRPGHPMKLGALDDGRPLIALPGNPLAAVSGLVTLAWPLVRAQSGRRPAKTVLRPLGAAVDASPGAHRLVPGQLTDGVVHLTARRGPAMLSGMAVADVVAVIPPRRPVDAGTEIPVIALPWGSGLIV